MQPDRAKALLDMRAHPEGYHSFIPNVHCTLDGTPYLAKPGVALLAKPAVSLDPVAQFLGGYGAGLEFDGYTQDPVQLDPGTQLCKVAGQLCYLSFGPRRTPNAEAGRYFENIRSSGHGSVLRHANYTFLLWGVDRAVTHELVRHAAGVAPSQVSQRYVNGRALRFVEDPAFQGDPELHQRFQDRIDRAAAEYELLAEKLLALQSAGSQLLSAEARTDLRKKVQQAARRCLPNEAEAPIILTFNVQALRHVIEQRASQHADVPIRAVGVRLFLIMQTVEPVLFQDYQLAALGDGTLAVSTPYRKV